MCIRDRATLEPSDFMNQVEAALKASLASLGQQYEKMCIRDRKYTVWVEPDKPWQAKSEFNELHFEGEGADLSLIHI